MAECPKDTDFAGTSSSSEYPLSFIIECFGEPIKQFASVMDLCGGLIQTGILSRDKMKLILNKEQQETQSDAISELLETLNHETPGSENDYENGTKFIDSLRKSSPKNRVLAHGILGVGPIPAHSEEEQQFRKALRENLLGLKEALSSDDIVTAIMKHIGHIEGERLQKINDCRYLHMYLTLERIPGPIKDDIIEHLKEQKYTKLATCLEKQWNTNNTETRDELDDEDVVVFQDGFESISASYGDMSGCPPTTQQIVHEEPMDTGDTPVNVAENAHQEHNAQPLPKSGSPCFPVTGSSTAEAGIPELPKVDIPELLLRKKAFCNFKVKLAGELTKAVVHDVATLLGYDNALIEDLDNKGGRHMVTKMEEKGDINHSDISKLLTHLKDAKYDGIAQKVKALFDEYVNSCATHTAITSATTLNSSGVTNFQQSPSSNSEQNDVQPIEVDSESTQNPPDQKHTYDTGSTSTTESQLDNSVLQSEPLVNGEENGESSFITLRKDQLELVSKAEQTGNVIILAPTNSGKTYVAAEIIKRHFDRAVKSRRRPKAAFIVERKVLAEQQVKNIRKYFQGAYPQRKQLKVEVMTGDTKVPDLDIFIDPVDVVVCTAGKLRAKCGQVEPDTDGAVLIDRFSLLIFDECHHCLGQKQYNRLMRLYRKDMMDHEDSGGSPDMLPKVIGITATLGSGSGGTSRVKARECGLSILANLNISPDNCIATVEREKASLDEYRNFVQEADPVFVERRDKDPVADKIIGLMEEIEKEMSSLPDYDLIPCIPDHKPRDGLSYKKWVTEMKTTKCPQLVESGENRLPLMVCLDHLLIYHQALYINQEARSVDAIHFLKEEFDKIQEEKEEVFIDQHWKFRKSFIHALGCMKKIITGAGYPLNPLLVELEELIQQEFEKKRDSRAILFTERIINTEFLKRWILASPKLKCLLKPCTMTGKTSQSERENLVRRFTSGQYNMIISTSVMEEGIDVPDCNLVYQLNYVPIDCARLQQRKGRVRAKDGKSFLVCHGIYRTNAAIAKLLGVMMSGVAKDINAMHRDERKTSLEKYQKLDMMSEEEALRKRKRIQEMPKDHKEWMLQCRKCDEYACSSYDVKRVDKHRYVCMQSFIDEKIEIVPHRKARKLYDCDTPMEIVKKTLCKKCKNPWGNIAIIHGSRVPVITMKSFVLVEVTEDGKKRRRVMPKRWEQCPFAVTEVDSVEEVFHYECDFDD